MTTPIMRLEQKLYFLYDDPTIFHELSLFLSPFYQIASESLSFSLQGIKTKELYGHIDERLNRSSFDFMLILHDQKLELFDREKRRIRIDFDEDKINYARKVIAKDPFLRAIGRDRRNVLDVSAGLGIDAVFLSQHGHAVTAVERNPLLYVLLSQAHKRSRSLSKLSLHFKFGDAIQFIQKNSEYSHFDCIYFDPMFPDKTKSALPRQEMVLFRQLVGNDKDAGDVLNILLQNRNRIVVKRPSYAEPIGGKPSNAFESKLIRFDIYEGK